jgi:hypothetical protein
MRAVRLTIGLMSRPQNAFCFSNGDQCAAK